jgi:hypothetical protein
MYQTGIHGFIEDILYFISVAEVVMSQSFGSLPMI